MRPAGTIAGKQRSRNAGRACQKNTRFRPLRVFGSRHPSDDSPRFRVRANARPGMTAFRPSFRRPRVITNRRTRANQIPVAVDIVDPPHRAPVFVRTRTPCRKAPFRAGIGPRPVIVGNVVHGVRRMAQWRGFEVVELPTVWRDRKWGTSKFRLGWLIGGYGRWWLQGVAARVAQACRARRLTEWLTR